MPRKQPGPTKDVRRAYIAWCVTPLNERNPRKPVDLARRKDVWGHTEEPNTYRSCPAFLYWLAFRTTKGRGEQGAWA